VNEQAKQPRQLWRTFNTLLGAGHAGQSPKNCPSAQQFADFFAAKVEAVRKATGGSDVTSELPLASGIFDHFQPCTIDDVRSVIMAAPTKSCALDPLPTDVLKSFLPDLLPFLTDLCNASLEQGCLPLSERHAIVTPRIKKPGADPIDVQNYRPVSNLTFVSKVVERLVCRQLVAFLERLGLLPSLQSAYRKHHSTETAVLKVISDVLRAADRGDVSLLCMLDMSAAFDTVDHDILVDRLRKSFGVQGRALAWIKSFLQCRTQSVRIAGQESRRSSLACGVPQGSVLGPILFLIYCADVIAIARRHGLGVHSYADDTQLYFHADPEATNEEIQRLVACVDELSRWMCANRLKLNTDKTQFIWLGTPHQLSNALLCRSIRLGGVDIVISTEATCLGVVLDSRLTFAPHVRRLSGKCFFHLRRIRTIRGSLTEDAARTLVHAFIASRIDYCNSVLYGISAVHLHPLQTVLHAAARVVLRLRKFDHVTVEIRDRLHWLPVKQRVEYKMCTIIYKCLQRTAPLYLTEMFLPVSANEGRRHLRSAAHGDLETLRFRMVTYGKRSFPVSGPRLWNNLELTVRNTLPLTQFCARLKTELFARAYKASCIAPP
jgi:hypothetical protein